MRLIELAAYFQRHPCDGKERYPIGQLGRKPCLMQSVAFRVEHRRLIRVWASTSCARTCRLLSLSSPCSLSAKRLVRIFSTCAGIGRLLARPDDSRLTASPRWLSDRGLANSDQTHRLPVRREPHGRNRRCAFGLFAKRLLPLQACLGEIFEPCSILLLRLPCFAHGLRVLRPSLKQRRSARELLIAERYRSATPANPSCPAPAQSWPRAISAQGWAGQLKLAPAGVFSTRPASPSAFEAHRPDSAGTGCKALVFQPWTLSAGGQHCSMVPWPDSASRIGLERCLALHQFGPTLLQLARLKGLWSDSIRFALQGCSATMPGLLFGGAHERRCMCGLSLPDWCSSFE